MIKKNTEIHTGMPEWPEQYLLVGSFTSLASATFFFAPVHFQDPFDFFMHLLLNMDALQLMNAVTMS